MKTPEQLRASARRARTRADETAHQAELRRLAEEREAAERVLPQLRERLEKGMEIAARSGEDQFTLRETEMGSVTRGYKVRSQAMHLLHAELTKDPKGFTISWPHEDYDTGTGSDPGPPISSTSMTISWEKK